MLMMVGAVLGLILKLVIFTSFLSEEEVGLLSVLIDASNILAAFIPLGSTAVFMRYIPYFRTGKDRRPEGLLFIGVILTAIGFLIFTLLFFLLDDHLIAYYSERASLLSKYFFYLVPLVLARVIYVLFSEYSVALKRNIFPVLLREIVVRLLTGLTVVLFTLDYFDIDGLVFWFVMVYYVSATSMLIYLRRHKELRLLPKRSNYTKERLKEMASFGSFTFLSSGAAVLYRNMDTIFVTSLIDLSAAGIYSIAFLIGNVIEMPRKALTQSAAPFVAEASSKNQREKLSELYQKSAINQFIVGAIMLLCIWTCIDSLFSLIENGDQYAKGKYVVLFIGLGKLFNMSTGVNSQIIQNSPYYRFNFYTMIMLAGISITMNFIFIPIYGLVGAAIASMASSVIINSIRAVYLKWRMKIVPFDRYNLMALVLLLITYSIMEWVPDFENPVLNILWNSGLSIFLFGGAAYALKLSPDMNGFVHNVIKRFIKK